MVIANNSDSIPQLAIREIEPLDAALINQYWADTDEKDWERLGELGRPDPRENLAFIQSLCAERPEPQRAEEGILMWCADGMAVGYSTLKAIQFREQAQIHLHMWEKPMRGRGIGAILFCLSALEFIRRFELKKLYCQPNVDNPMPNRMLRRLGFLELPAVDYRRADGSSIQQSRFLIVPRVAESHLRRYPDFKRS